jgi:hypothetical protein
MLFWSGSIKGGLAGTSVWVTESQEGAPESLKGPIALAMDILFRFFIFLGVFSNIFSFCRKIIM